MNNVNIMISNESTLTDRLYTYGSGVLTQTLKRSYNFLYNLQIFRRTLLPF